MNAVAAKTMLATLRKAAKTIDPEAKVSGVKGEVCFYVTFPSMDSMDQLKPTLAAQGLEVAKPEIIGSRWDWSYRYEVFAKSS